MINDAGHDAQPVLADLEVSMAHSYQESVTITCAQCGNGFAVNCWLVIDIAERPDLLEQICAGTIHDAICPHCAATTHCDAPILVYRPQKALNAAHQEAGQAARPDSPAHGEPQLGPDSPILFSPAENTTSEQDWQHARHLLTILRGALGEQWLPQGIPMVPRSALCASLAAQAG